jgi:hypothetical protein
VQGLAQGVRERQMSTRDLTPVLLHWREEVSTSTSSSDGSAKATVSRR